MSNEYWNPRWKIVNAVKVCEHGVAQDIHCCNCHEGYKFDGLLCRCLGDGE